MPEAIKAVGQRWFDEIWNKGRREAIGELLHPDAVVYEGAEGISGQAFYSFFDRLQNTFSDMRLTVDDMVAEGDRVCVRWSCSMRHTGTGLGMPATGKVLKTTGITIMQIQDGKVISGWQNWDMLGLMQQINDQSLGATYIAAGS
jgi:steroid delta-isomerase-like uncharacterized protein